MKLFAISDLHLSGHCPKPMDVFGAHWENHWMRICDAWRERVSPDDAVLIPGDISWAMTLEQAMGDLADIAGLPGTKVLLRGNHDYWWGGLARVRSALPKSMRALQNDAVRIGDLTICGTRGWTCPGSSSWEGAGDEKIYLRELVRLRLSLDAARRLPDGPLVAMLHFPPFNERLEPSGYTKLLEEYGVRFAVYGHLHALAPCAAFEGERNGVLYRMVSCDYLDFKPAEILQREGMEFSP